MSNTRVAKSLFRFIWISIIFSFVFAGNVFAAGDMQPVSFTDTPDPLASNGEVVYTIEFKNNAPDTADNPVLDVTVPTGFTYITSDFAGCSYSGNNPSQGLATDIVHCTADTFPGSTSADINITLRAPIVAGPTVFESDATASCDDDINPANNMETIKTTVVEGSDLNLTKTSLTNPAIAGGIVTYRFDVVNNGPHEAKDLNLLDTLPGGLTFVGDDASPAADNDADWGCSASGQDVTCTGGDLSKDATSTFYFRVKVSQSSTSGDIINSATVSSTTTEVAPDDNTDTDTLVILPGTDMGIVKAITTTPAISGQNVTFTLDVTNNGPMLAEDVNVTDILPTGYTNILASAPGWTCDVSNNPTITCTRTASMPVGASETITITAQAPTVTSIVVHRNDAIVGTTTADPIPDNNTDTVSYALNPDNADLSLTKTKSPTPLAVGDIATSVITVRNNGPRDANPVQIVDVLSANETYISDNGTNWSCTHTGADVNDGTGGTVTCDYSQTLAINVTAPDLNILTEATHEGTLENRACTGGSEGSDEPLATDTNTANNCADANVSSTDPSGIGTADIRVIKTADDYTIEPNENSFTYTINVKNREGNTSQDVEFRDTIPQYVSAFGGRPATTLTATTTRGDVCTITAALVVCQLGDMLLNDEVNVTITVERPMADGSRDNTASAYSPVTGDSNRNNNEDTATVNVLPVAEIELQSKIVTPSTVLAGTEATYTIQIRNNGPSIAKDVNITDVFSGKPFTFISASSGCAFSADTLTCDMGDMVSGQTHSVEVVIRPDHLTPAPADWNITNTATVTMSTLDSNPNNNEKNATLVVTGGELDLAIEKSESLIFHEPVSFDPNNLANNLIVYHVEVHNYGPSLATDVKFSDRMLSVSPDHDQNLTFERDTGNADGTDDGTSVCTGPTGLFKPGTSAPTIDCSISELASGGKYERYLVFHVEDAPHLVTGDVYRDEINVTSRETDTLLGNNVEDERTTVRVTTDPQIVKTVSTSSVEVGQEFTYNLKITNNGPGYSPETMVSDNLPTGMVLTGTPTISPAQGSCNGASGDTSFTCRVDEADGTLHSQHGDAGGISEVNITVPVMVTNWTQDTLNNIANVTTTGPDSNTDNNEDNVTVTVLKPAHIGNRVWHDIDANGIQDSGELGINGVTVYLVYENNGSIAQTTTTNSSGVYNFDVNHSTDYRVEFDLSSSALTDYRITTENNTSTTDALDSDINATGATGSDLIEYGETNTTFDAGFFKVASIGNRVWLDNNGNGRQGSSEVGVADINVTLYDGNGTQVTADIDGNVFGTGGVVTTNTDGNYIFSNLRPGDYYVVFDKSTLPVDHVFAGLNSGNDNIDSNANRNSGRTVVTSLISDENDTSWDAGIYEPVSIGDFVWHDVNGDGIQDSNENNLSGVDVALFYSDCTSRVREQNGTVNIAPITTDSSGYYLFDNLRPRTYCVVFTAQDSKYVITQQNVTASSDLNDSDTDPSNGRASGNVLTSGEHNRSVDAGFYIPLTLGDRVWIDTNYNGMQDNGEQNLTGMTVELYADGAPTGTTDVTDANGYLFTGLAPGPRYSVRFHPLGGYNFTLQDQVGSDDTNDSDANITTGLSSGQTPTSLSHDVNLSFDAGVYQPVVIGDKVWEDTDADGIQDVGEAGIQGVTVTLVIDGVVQAAITDITDANGEYLFDASYDLKPNHTYSVQFSQPVSDSANPYQITTPDAGSDDGADSDISAIDTPVPATPLMYSGDSNDTLDAGFFRDASMGNRVWIDANGNGIQDGGEVGQGNVTVRLYPSTQTSPTPGNAIDTNSTDSNGFYHFNNLRPGSYYVIFDKTTLPAEYVFTQKNAGTQPGAADSDVNLTTGRSDPVTLISNQDDNSTDAGIYIPVSIGDYTWVDEDGDGQQDVGEAVLPGTKVQLWNASGQVTSDLSGTTFGTAGTVDTNATGGYLFDNLRPDTYYVKFAAPGSYLITLQNQGSSDNNDSDANGVANNAGQTGNYILTSGEDNRSVDAGFYEPVEVGDRVWIDRNYNGIQDTNEQNLTGVDVTLYQDGIVYGVPVTTDANGEYLFDNLPQGHRYSVEFSNLPGDYRFTRQDAGADDSIDSDANVTTGRTAQTAFMTSGASDLTLDAGVYEPVIIGDYVWEDVNGDGIQNDGATGVPGVLVTLLINGTVHTDINATTDATGFYLFDASYDLKPGNNYSVQFATSPSYFFTVANVGTDNNDSDPDTSGQNVAATPIMYTGEENRTLDAGIYFGASLGDKVWLDENGNGIQDGGEAGVDGVQAELFDAATGLTTGLTQNTAGGGLYHFTNLSPGSYYVVFSNLPLDHVFTQQNQGGDNTLDSDVTTATGISDTVILTSGQDDNTTDAGIYLPVSVGDRIWHDVNADGNQSGESNIAQSVTVTLTDNNDATNNYTTTTANGDYLFADVRPGDYHIVFTMPANYDSVSPQDTTNDAEDSDVDTGTLRTVNFDLVSGIDQLTWDMGVYNTATIGDTVWIDVNADGIQDAGETGLNGVTVELYKDGIATGITTTTTTATVGANSGMYEFADLEPGNYSVHFTPTGTYVISPQDVTDNGTDDTNDSDVNATTFLTETTILVSGENDPTWDAGMYVPASIGDRIWLDSNGDGIQNNGEGNYTLGMVTVHLEDENNASVTDASGVAVTPITTTTGAYNFTNLVPGTYHMRFDFSATAGIQISPLNTLVGGTDSDVRLDSNTTVDTVLESGENDTSWDAGLFDHAGLGDTVWIDTNGNGIQDDAETLDINVTANLYYDTNGSLADTQTILAGSNGQYSFINVDPNDYYVEFVLPAGSGYRFISANKGNDDTVDSDVNAAGLTPMETISSNEFNETLDAGIYIPANIGDRVWLDANANGIQDPNESNISDINVTLFDDQNVSQGTVQTDVNGTYLFNGLVPGDYHVEFALTDNNGQAYVVSPQTGVPNDGNNSDANATGATAVETLVSGEQNPNYDAGLYIPVAIGDFVWSDRDGNGIQNVGEAGIQDVNVTLFRQENNGTITTIGSQDTNSTGGYLFTGLVPGNYYVHFDQPDHFRPTVQNSGTNDAADSDADLVSGNTALFELFSPDDNLTLDAGFYALATISGNVSEDIDNDDIGDVNLQFVDIALVDSNGVTVATTQTDNNGSYIFIDVEPGTYTVVETQPAGLASVSENEGGADNDPGNNTLDNIISVVVGIGENDVNNDFVEEAGVTIGDRVWNDENGDGIQDPTETNVTGLDSIVVNLYNIQDILIATTTTDFNGEYLFVDYPEDTYYIGFDLATLPAHYGATQPNQGSDDTNDSDVLIATGITGSDYLSPGEDNRTFDMGIYLLGTISGTVLEDLNDDDIGDKPMAGVEIVLYDANGNEVARTLTAADGTYIFTDLPQGVYTIRETQPSGYLDVGETDGDMPNDGSLNSITVTLDAGEHDANNDYIEEIGGSIGNYVWHDTNGDGLQDLDETGVNAVHICLEDDQGNAILDANGIQRCTDTNATGYYLFEGILPGDYVLVFEIPTGTTLTPFPQEGTDEAVDSDPLEVIGGFASAPVTMGLGQDILTIDMGLVYLNDASIGDFVWIDENRDGIFDDHEVGLDGVTVNLYDNAGHLLETILTHSGGKYLFEHLAAGTYIVEFVVPNALEYEFTAEHIGTGELDSDADTVTGRTAPILLREGEHIVVVDAGVYCGCEDAPIKANGGDALGLFGMFTMMLMTLLTGLFFVRKEEEQKI